jgi:uncharacterized membrane protein
MRQRNSDMFVAMAIAALNIVGAFLPTRIFLISAVLALPLVFFSPGYVLIEMIALKRTLGAFHRILFSLGLSITLDSIGGFLLNILPVGLRAESWVVLLGSFTLLFALLVPLLRVGTDSLRPAGITIANKDAMNRSLPYSSVQSHAEISIVRGGAVLGLAILLVVGALVYATNGVTQQPHTGFTQLWMLPPAQSEQQCVVHLGVRSFELTPVTYHATLSVNTVREVVWPSIVLAPQQIWEQPIFVPTNATHATTIQVQLYKGNSSTSVYRQVHITLHFNETGKIYRCA